MSTGPVSSVTGGWGAAVVGWVVSVWQWFAGDASGMAVMIGVGTLLLTAVKLAQELQTWRARSEEKQVLSKLWGKLNKKTRPGNL